ncbi:MAG: DoxX family protein [Saprospiraceae bacterium]|nr:DoxX family protein [Saprospiraceae bacterium]
MKDITDLLGRICIALIFVYEALDTTLFFNNTKRTMAEYGITWKPDLLLYIVIVFLVVGAIMVLIGYYANIGALLLLSYWLPFTLIVYSFWNDPQPLQRLNALYFMRNLAVCGGLLLLMANGAGRYSVKRLIHVMRLPK